MLLRWLLPRFFRFAQHEGFVRLLRHVAELGVGIGVGSLILVLSVMRGFDHELTKRFQQLGQDLIVRSPDAISATNAFPFLHLLPHSELRSVLPFVEGEVLLERKSFDEVYSQVAALTGVSRDWLTHAKRVRYLQAEAVSEENLVQDFEQRQILLGFDLAQELWVHPDHEHEIAIIAPLAGVGPQGDWLPNHVVTKAAALFQSGVYTFDRSHLIMDFEAAKNLLGLQARFGWFFALNNPSQSTVLAQHLKKEMPSTWTVETWQDRNQRLLQALSLERKMMTLVLVFVVLLATFSIMGLMYLIVLKRQREIALLVALGMTSTKLVLLFSGIGVKLGLRGALLGGLMAQAAVFALQKLHLPLPASYYLEVLPADLSWLRFTSFVIFGLLLAVLASAWPAWQSTKVPAHHYLRFE